MRSRSIIKYFTVSATIETPLLGLLQLGRHGTGHGRQTISAIGAIRALAVLFSPRRASVIRIDRLIGAADGTLAPTTAEYRVTIG